MLKATAASRIFKRKHGTVNALDNATLEIRAGEFVGITGQSGSGKSTLLLALGGMSHPDQGHVYWNEESIYKWSIDRLSDWRGTNIGFVFQSFNLVPYLTVFENVSAGLALANIGTASTKSINDILDEVNLGDRKDHLPSELSVGQQQRVALARALVKKPRLILADEPTGNLDPATGNEVMNIIRRQHAAGTTVVIITHDPAIVRQADRRVTIVDGRIVT